MKKSEMKALQKASLFLKQCGLEMIVFINMDATDRHFRYAEFFIDTDVKKVESKLRRHFTLHKGVPGFKFANFNFKNGAIGRLWITEKVDLITGNKKCSVAFHHIIAD